MNRQTITTILIVAIIAAMTCLVLVAVTGDDTAEFGQGSYAEIEQAVNRAGLDLAGGTPGEADVTGGWQKAVYDVSAGGAEGLMVVRTFSGPDQLDAIGEDSYVGDSALGYRWQQYTVSVTDSTPPEVIDGFREAMDDLGAKVIYDHLD